MFFCLAVVLAVTHTLWFPWLGGYLVQADPLVKADAVLVLAGDWNGDRIVNAAELVKQGYAPAVYVSGPMTLYGVNEATLAINYAVSRGYSRDIFVPMISGAFSTRDEVAYFGPELRRKGVHRLLIVTSDFHTRRAGKLFRKGLGPDFEIHMIPTPDRHFTPNGWWQDREGQKVLFFEWSKTIAVLLGL